MKRKIIRETEYRKIQKRIKEILILIRDKKIRPAILYSEFFDAWGIYFQSSMIGISYMSIENLDDYLAKQYIVMLRRNKLVCYNEYYNNTSDEMFECIYSIQSFIGILLKIYDWDVNKLNIFLDEVTITIV